MSDPQPDPPSAAESNDSGAAPSPPSRWRWLIPLAGIVAIALFIWAIFLPPGATDAAAEAVCFSTAQLTFTLESGPEVSADGSVDELDEWLLLVGKQVVIVSDLARAVRLPFSDVVDAYDAVGSALDTADGSMLGLAAEVVEARLDDLGEAVGSLADVGGC